MTYTISALIEYLNAWRTMMSDQSRVMRVLQGLKPGPNTMCNIGIHDWPAWEHIGTDYKFSVFRMGEAKHLVLKRCCANCNLPKFKLVRMP